MSVQHKLKPKHLAVAISMALACVEPVYAQQPFEAADVPTITSAIEPPEIDSIATALEQLHRFVNDSDTVPTALNSPHEAFKGTDKNDLISLKDGATFTGRLDGGGGDNILVLDAGSGDLKDTQNFNGLFLSRGNWTLSSKGDFEKGALVTSGTTLVNTGSIKGGIYVERGGSFAGKGTVGNLHVDGLLSVNGALGSPRVKGDLHLSPTAELAYEVTPGGSQTIKVDGTASLEGATLKVVAPAQEYPQSSQYKIIEAKQIEGKFGSVINDLAFMTATPQYNKKSVGLTYARNEVPFKSVATTENGGALGDSIIEPQAPSAPELAAPTSTSISSTLPTDVADADADSAAITHEVPALAVTTGAPSQSPAPASAPLTIDQRAANAPATQSSGTPAPQPQKPANSAVAALLTSDRKTASVALEQLAAGSNANLAKATLSSASPVSASMLSAMHQLGNREGTQGSGSAPRLAAGGEGSGRVWLQALGHGGKVDRDFDSVLKHSTHGLVLGADWRFDEQWHLGLMGAKAQTRFDARQFDGDLDSWHLGAYALRQDGPFALRLGASYGGHDGSGKRRVAFNGFSDRLKSSYKASTQQVFAEVGYNLGRGNVSIEPFAGVGYQRYQRDGYTEKGGDAALKVHGQTQANPTSTVGLRMAKTSHLPNGLQLTPRLSASMKRTYGALDNETRQQLVKGGKSFEVIGAGMDRNLFTLDAGLDLTLSTRNTLGVGISGDAGSDSRSYGVTGQWRMEF